jgi:glutamyl/glutaminyl-tRNA synthetase
MMPVRTRFAPSPTGSLHVGGARTALYCLLYARKQGGRFLLRIEDTDQARSTDEAAAGILRDLRWLGLDWDEGPGAESAGTGPYFQSQRLDTYGPVFETLLASGHAYEAWDSPAELEALREQARADKTNFRYRRQSYTPEQLASFRAEGREPVLRLQAPAHDIHIEDDILGTVSLAADELEDIVIRKADGFPTYHFAVVVDDHLMLVTQILRGQEHLLNTPKHLGLYEALGWTPPSHGHLPLIFNPAGAKMSKRDKARTARDAARDEAKARGTRGLDPKDWSWLAQATGHPLDAIEQFMAKKSDGVALAQAIADHLRIELPMIEVMDFRAGGYLPEALLNYLALLGWSPGDDREILTIDEMVAAFSLEGINKTAARFDPVKLAWMNGEYIRAATPERLLAAHDSYLEVAPRSPLRALDERARARLIALYRARMSTFADLDRMAAFFFEAPTAYDNKAVKKHLTDEGKAHLRALRDQLATTPEWTAEALHAAVESLAASLEVGMGKLAQPARIALTGTAVSPEIGDTLELIGRASCLARIDACLAAHP